jgi:hypothetical protein
MRTSRRITYEDRCQMYALHQAGSTQAEIGMAWGFSQGTSRALSRNKGPRKPGADPAAWLQAERWGATQPRMDRPDDLGEQAGRRRSLTPTEVFHALATRA